MTATYTDLIVGDGDLRVAQRAVRLLGQLVDLEPVLVVFGAEERVVVGAPADSRGVVVLDVDAC